MVHTCVSIIGAGAVGAAVAYSLMSRKVAAEILLVDIDTVKRDGEVLDMQDGAFYTGTVVRAGSYQDAGQSNICIITAGCKQREGETRLQLLDRNRKIIDSVVESMKPLNPNLIILCVTNPCDIITTYAQRASGLPKSQVFGSGTFLDSQRLRKLIAERIKVNETAVHVYVVGEHGDSQVAVFSSASVGGVPLLEFPVEPRLTLAELKQFAEQAKQKAYAIIKAKGATYYGIATVTTSICESIVFNQHSVRPVSCYIEKYKMCISMPAVIGSKGIEKILEIKLNAEEQASFDAAAAYLATLSTEV